jgi:hypothetical protein
MDSRYVAQVRPSLYFFTLIYYQNERPPHNSRGLRKIFGKTRRLFRSSIVPKCSHPVQPLVIPALPQRTSDLQDEIDEELLLLSEGNVPYDSCGSSSPRSQPHTNYMCVGSGDLAVSGNQPTPPSTISAGFAIHDAPKPHSPLSQGTGSGSQDLGQNHGEAQSVDGAAERGSQPLPDAPFGASSSQRDAAAESSILVCLSLCCFGNPTNCF